MSHISIDIRNLYSTYFGKPYKVSEQNSSPEFISPYMVPEQWQDFTADRRTLNNQPISIRKSTGVEVFLPVELWVSDRLNLTIECATIRVTNKKTIVRTAVSERRGTIKEQFNVGDYIFNIKGVLIGEHNRLPDEKISTLKEIYENDQPVFLRNAFAELFMPNTRIAIESLEFPEVIGKSIAHRPFTMVCESDFVNTLTVI